RLAAELGYDFNYVHEVRTPGVDGVGLTGDLGFKIETGLKVALGLSVSGRYLILVGRESDKNEEIRLRMFKLSKKEFTFGLNLSASVQDMDSPAPDSVDALIQAVFGLHGLQIIKDLQAIERWTDPSQDLSDLAPGLPSETGLELLRATTGFDPATAFSDARNALLGVLKQLDSLPGSVPSKLWSLLGSMNEQANKVFRDGVKALAVEDAEQRREAVVKLISVTAFDDEPIGQWLTAVAASGLLALTDELGRVGEAARATLALLEGNILKALREFLEDRLSLDQLRKVTNETSFRKLDPFLVNRLSMFLDEELGFHNLGKVREAINHALRLRQEIHSKAREAITSKYEFDFAYNYQKTTIKNALVDVVFDFSRQSARDLFRDVVDGSLAVRLAAELGYDFNYVHDVRTPGVDGVGLTGDLGFKIEKGLKVALGLSVSEESAPQPAHRSSESYSCSARPRACAFARFDGGVLPVCSRQGEHAPCRPETPDTAIHFRVHAGAVPAPGQPGDMVPGSRSCGRGRGW
ncbi:MAG: hypothetical protein DMG09_21130, partial [Acidobacteria bacterium]